MSIILNGTTGITFDNGSAQDVGSVGTGGQTWQDLTASRISGNTYTNSTGKPIMVAVTGTRSNDVSRLSMTINGLAVGSAWSGTSASTEQRAFMSIIVPNGSTYTAQALTGSIFSWYELR